LDFRILIFAGKTTVDNITLHQKKIRRLDTP